MVCQGETCCHRVWSGASGKGQSEDLIPVVCFCGALGEALVLRCWEGRSALRLQVGLTSGEGMPSVEAAVRRGI